MPADDLRQDTFSETSSVEREVVIPAPMEEVWEIVTGDGWLADQVALDLVPGGDALFTSHHGARAGWVEQVQPPEGSGAAARLVFWWESADEQASRVELTLEHAGEDATRLRVSEARPLEVLDLTGIPLPGPESRSYGPSMLAVA